MIIEQILVTGMAVFCYLIVDSETKEAVLIDPAGDFDLIFEKVKKHQARIKYVINTHGHYDHVSGNDYVIKKTDAVLLIHVKDFKDLKNTDKDDAGLFNKKADKKILLLQHNDVVKIGKTELKIIHTPGHTEGGISILAEGNIFTGDTLFTEGVGRTDFAGGSAAELQRSILNRILSLPDNTKIFPGHHYGRKPSSTVKEQKSNFGIR